MSNIEAKGQCEIKKFFSDCELSFGDIKEKVKSSLFSWLEDHDYYEDDMDSSSNIAFSELGLTSMDSVGLIEKIRLEFDVNLDATSAWQYPNVSSLSSYVADLVKENAQTDISQDISVNDVAQKTHEELDICAQLEALLLNHTDQREA